MGDDLTDDADVHTDVQMYSVHVPPPVTKRRKLSSRRQISFSTAALSKDPVGLCASTPHHHTATSVRGGSRHPANRNLVARHRSIDLRNTVFSYRICPQEKDAQRMPQRSFEVKGPPFCRYYGIFYHHQMLPIAALARIFTSSRAGGT